MNNNCLRLFTNLDDKVFKQYENPTLIAPRVGETIWVGGEKYEVLTVDHSYDEAGWDCCDCVIEHIPFDVWNGDEECGCCCCECMEDC